MRCRDGEGPLSRQAVEARSVYLWVSRFPELYEVVDKWPLGPPDAQALRTLTLRFFLWCLAGPGVLFQAFGLPGLNFELKFFVLGTKKIKNCLDYQWGQETVTILAWKLIFFLSYIQFGLGDVRLWRRLNKSIFFQAHFFPDSRSQVATLLRKPDTEVLRNATEPHN